MMGQDLFNRSLKITVGTTPNTKVWTDLSPEVQDYWGTLAAGIMDLNDTAQLIHEWARSKGFYDREMIETNGPESVENPSLPSEKLALMVEEIGECVKALRKGDAQNEAEEIADLVIRALDYSAWRGISIHDAINRKMSINVGRPYLHGEDRVF